MTVIYLQLFDMGNASFTHLLNLDFEEEKDNMAMNREVGH